MSDINEMLPAGVRNFMMFGVSQRLSLYKMLSALIRGSVPIDVCLRHLYERKAKMKRPDAYILKKWLSRMDRGDPFHEAIKDEVPAQERVLIAAGSMADSLADGIDQAIKATQGSQKIKGALKGGLSQPIALMIAVMGILIGFSKYMAPDFAKMLPEDQWTGGSGMLLKVAQRIEIIWPYLIIAIITIVVVFVRSLPKWIGKTRSKLDNYFPYSIYRSYTSASFLIALSSLLKSGTPLDGALKRIKLQSAPWLSWHISIMLRNMDRGLDPGTAMDTGLIDPVTTDQLYIYAKSADFSQSLKDIGEQAIEQGIETITAQAQVGKIISLICVGVIVSWIQVSLLDLQSKMSAPQNATSVSKAVK